MIFMEKITKESTLQDILNLSGAEDILAKYKVPCLACPMAKLEMHDLKIGDICKMYGIDEKKLLEDLKEITK